MRYDFGPLDLICETCEGTGTFTTWASHPLDDEDEDSMRMCAQSDLCPDCLGRGVMLCVSCGDEAVVTDLADSTKTFCSHCRPIEEPTDDLRIIRQHWGRPNAPVTYHARARR